MVLKVFEAFAGVGSQRMALQNLGIGHEVVAISEIDKFAIASYEAIHGEILNLGDISQISAEDIPEHDLFTYSFPCQDISVAGKQGGLDINSGTRSGLLWECQKVITAKKPKYLLLENVKNLVGKRHRANFDLWLKWLEEQGHSNYWQVLNAKDYGIPQNRERVFVVSILGEHEPYSFPEKQQLQINLQDMLSDEIEEKYYIRDGKINIIQSENQAGYLSGGKWDKIYESCRRFYNTNKISPTVHTSQGGNTEIKVIVGNTVRKLTPLEYWRLMGFTDIDFCKAQAVNSNSQLYKQAGNSIVVPVLEAIFKQLFLKEEVD